MTEKRLIVDEDYNLVDTVTGEWLDDTQIFDLANKLHEENEELKNMINCNDNNLNGVIYSYVIEFGKTKFYKNGRFMTSSEVLNELEVKDMIINQFSEENKELKQKIESLKMEIAELRESEKDNYNITDGLW